MEAEQPAPGAPSIVTRLRGVAAGVAPSRLVAGAGRLVLEVTRGSVRAASNVVIVAIDAMPIDEIIERIPLEQIVARIPIEQLMARIDVNALIGQIDIESLLGRIDIGKLTADALAGVDFGDLLRESTASVGTEVRDVTRTQAMNADVLLARVIDRVLRRSARQLDVGRPLPAPGPVPVPLGAT